MEKKYSLVLGGGAARGLCHTGVLKSIEEKDIVINEVCGTSMGAIIGAAIALGHNSADILTFTQSINFLKLFDLGSKKGIVAGGKVIKKLEEFLGNKDFKDTVIPLRIVATDLVNQQSKVFESGNILEAVRASISLPSILVPKEIDGIKYVDGGLRQNLPVLASTNVNIIAVSAISEKKTPLKEKRTFGSFSFKKSFFSVNYQILRKTIATMMKTNEQYCIEIATLQGKNITLLTPDISNFEYYEFHKAGELFERGYEESQLKLVDL